MQNAGTDKNTNILTPASSNMQAGPVNNFEISSLQPMFSQSISFFLNWNTFLSLIFSSKLVSDQVPRLQVSFEKVEF